MTKQVKQPVRVWAPDGVPSSGIYEVIGHASSWDEAAVVFGDWCERKGRDYVLYRYRMKDCDPPNGIAIRSECMEHIADLYGLDSFPAFNDHWTWWEEPGTAEPHGYHIDPLALSM